MISLKVRDKKGERETRQTATLDKEGVFKREITRQKETLVPKSLQVGKTDSPWRMISAGVVVGTSNPKLWEAEAEDGKCEPSLNNLGQFCLVSEHINKGLGM